MPKVAKYESVAGSIRQEIQALAYAAGDPLNTEELAGKYVTTKATVSRALAVLADAGLVTPAGDGWTVAEPESRMTAKAEELATGKDVEVRRAPQVLEGRVVTEHVDPDAERALKNRQVAADYNTAKASLRTYADLDGKRTEALKAVAASLVTLRSHFKEPGTRGRRVDWNGNSVEYNALAALLYRDVGLEGEQAESTKRAIRHHVEDRKRAVVPVKDWDHYNIQALTRGERAGLEKRAAKALTGVADTSDATAGQAAKGNATGHQLVTLMSRIDQGMSVFSTASLRVMSPAQRKKFRDQAQEARDRADALLRELDGLDG
jgi:DNA-binding GntR family transcriptional regulator